MTFKGMLNQLTGKYRLTKQERSEMMPENRVPCSFVVKPPTVSEEIRSNPALAFGGYLAGLHPEVVEVRLYSENGTPSPHGFKKVDGVWQMVRFEES